MIELLAPAKDKECAKAAVDYGADALYIGAGAFGARKKAGNSVADIKEVVEYAHRFNVKVYIAINTILTEKEIYQAEKLIDELNEIGVDAVIVQDMGLFSRLQEKKIEMPIHASTQCDSRTCEKVEFLKNCGFSRVVLARELSVEQIKEIKSKTNAELEVFIHGALCVSYSGQCYLSQAIGGRSANRGECAQPCRKKYSLIDEQGRYIEKDKYLLCLKDFNASKYLKQLADAGVNSFKIEGRLKDVDYVRNVVGYYRKLIDSLGLKKTSSGSVFFDIEPELEKSFNRGFTDYFVDGKRKKISSFEGPKSKGEFIGEVSKVTKDSFEINFKKNDKVKINPQDGLCFSDGKDFVGCLVNKVEGKKIYPNKIPSIVIGAKIYRNFDAEFAKKLKSSKTCRKIQADIRFETNKISAIDEDNNFCDIEYNFEDFAKNEQKMTENIVNQLKKSGDSDFFINNVEILSAKIPFLPVSQLNELRRELLEKLMIKRLENYKKEVNSSHRLTEKVSYLKPIVDFRENVLNNSAKEFYEKSGAQFNEMALESGLSCAGRTVMTTKYCIKHALDMCKSKSKLFLMDEKGKKYELRFNCKNCEMEIIF